MGTKGKVLMAMSGGVDSSTAAVKLLDEGYELLGITMHLFCPDPDAGLGESSCCSLDDIADAREVARSLGFEHHVLNFSDAFDKNVIERFCTAYEAGKTPNPCVDCNRYLKFALLQQRRKELGCDFVATGHYARKLQLEDGTFALAKGLDKKKDQSYFLYHLDQETLAHMLFPLGNMEKTETRKLAKVTGLTTAEKSESQDICFVSEGNYAEFIEARRGKTAASGMIVDTEGNVIGTHTGLIRYTIGQRKGLNLGGGTDPLYVVAKNAAENTLVVGTKEELMSRVVTADDISFVSGKGWTGKRLVSAKIGYRMKDVPAHAWLDNDKVYVEFENPVRAVSPGQSLVLYDGEIALGGGTIC